MMNGENTGPLWFKDRKLSYLGSRMLRSKAETTKHCVFTPAQASFVHFLVYLLLLLGHLLTHSISWDIEFLPRLLQISWSWADLSRCSQVWFSPSLWHLHSFLSTMCVLRSASLSFQRKAPLWGCLVCSSLSENLFFLCAVASIMLQVLLKGQLQSQSVFCDLDWI